MIGILDGGFDKATGYYFVVMELLEKPWETLSSQVESFPREGIWPLISSIARAAQGLEALQLVHRDIKPQNIMVRPDSGECRLLDLGVLRPIGGGNLTDDASRPFIGTLRYTSPEFFLREEEDTIRGWRATTFYQLGGVLHDLIMRRPLFLEFTEPYGKLVQAVHEQIPDVDAPDVHSDLVLLCRNCLLKDPEVRLQCVSWESFEKEPRNFETPAEAARERVKMRRVFASQSKATPDAEQEKRNTQIACRELATQLKSIVREIVIAPEFPLWSLPDAHTNDVRTCAFELRFDAAPELRMPAECGAVFRLTVLDANERACRIELLPVAASAAQVDACANLTSEFTGVFDHESVRGAVRDFLYLLIDALQAKAVVR